MNLFNTSITYTINSCAVVNSNLSIYQEVSVNYHFYNLIEDCYILHEAAHKISW